MDKLLLSLIGSKKKFFERYNFSTLAFVSDYFVVYSETNDRPRYVLGRFRRFNDEVYFHNEFTSCFFGNFWKRVVKRNSFSDGVYIVVSDVVLYKFIDELNNLL